jgi:hypothetical protein
MSAIGVDSPTRWLRKCASDGTTSSAGALGGPDLRRTTPSGPTGLMFRIVGSHSRLIAAGVASGDIAQNCPRNR